MGPSRSSARRVVRRRRRRPGDPRPGRRATSRPYGLTVTRRVNVCALPPLVGRNVTASVPLTRLPCRRRAACDVERRSFRVTAPPLLTRPVPAASATRLPWLSVVTAAFSDPVPDTLALTDAAPATRSSNTTWIVIVPLRPRGPFGPAGPWAPTGPCGPAGPAPPCGPLSP